MYLTLLSDIVALASFASKHITDNDSGDPMEFEPALQPATLIKRYKRFWLMLLYRAVKKLHHCANTGAMTGCATPGDTIWYSTSNNTKRKYPYSWELTQTTNGHFICNTLRANQLVAQALAENTFQNYPNTA